MNVNLHIDSIVLEGIDMTHSQCQLLQQVVTSQLRLTLIQRGPCSQFTDSSNRTQVRTNSIYLGQTIDAATIGPQLTNAIYSSMRGSDINSVATHGGER